MTQAELTRRIVKENRNAARQKKRTGRFVQTALATWPGPTAMVSETAGRAWIVATVAQYERQHQEPTRKGAAIPITLLIALAEIVIEWLVKWWLARKENQVEFVRLHLQA